MISYLLAGPATEPVTLAEAKAWLRLDGGDEDGLVTTLIAAARIHIESTTGRAMLTQSWRVVLDGWPLDRTVTLPVAPLQTLTEIRAYDADGAFTTIALAQFQAESAVAPARLLLPPAITGMPALRERLGIEVDYVAGYGDDASAVPEDLRQALLVLVAHWFEHRDAVITAGAGTLIPLGFDGMVAPYKRVRL
jgi:uncharacterized phiE125 gp8 family phage protein